jgi:hypothetical protein
MLPLMVMESIREAEGVVILAVTLMVLLVMLETCICGKTNHSIFKCFKRFDPAYIRGEECQCCNIIWG